MAKIIYLSVPQDTLEMEYETRFVMGEYGTLEGVRYDIDIKPSMNPGISEDSIIVARSKDISSIHTNYFSDIEFAHDNRGGIVRFSTRLQGDKLSNYMNGVIIDATYQTNGSSGYDVYIKYLFRAYKMDKLVVSPSEVYSEPGGGGE